MSKIYSDMSMIMNIYINIGEKLHLLNLYHNRFREGKLAKNGNSVLLSGWGGGYIVFKKDTAITKQTIGIGRTCKYNIRGGGGGVC